MNEDEAAKGASRGGRGVAVTRAGLNRIETRRLVWGAVRRRVEFFADARMTGEVLRVLVAAGPDSRRHYPQTLFTAEEAYTDTCTARSTIYCANIAAGLSGDAHLVTVLKSLPNLPLGCNSRYWLHLETNMSQKLYKS